MNKLTIFSLLLTGSTLFPLQATAQNTVSAPMKDVNNVIDNTLDSLNKAKQARPVPGSSRKGNNPVLFLIGNSTMRNGTLGNGNNGQWGWGYYMENHFDTDKITVENQALGGTSSRTFYNRLWPDVLKGIKKGDWVIIELGHNDNGPYDSGRARASIPGIGKDSLNVTIKETGKKETVYTYGEYMRRFIHDVKAKGAHPILFSLTPRLAYDDKDSTKITRVNKTFGLWAKQVAEAEHVPFIDLNNITASRFEKYGLAKTKYMFYKDRIHSSRFGAMENAASAAEGIGKYPGLKLAQYLKPAEKDSTGSSRKGNNPVVFTIGDSTIRNNDNDPNGMWGLGSVLQNYFNAAKITVENCAKAGRSARTFLNEDRWTKVYNALRPGDFVIMSFGHNDGGDINVGKARGELHGISEDNKVFRMEKDGSYEVVYTYGWYLRKFANDTKEKGAIPIILSQTPRNIWKNGKVERLPEWNSWAEEVAKQTGAYYIDINDLTADALDKMGQEKAKAYFNHDHTHSSLKGANLNAQSIVKGLKAGKCPLKKYLKK